MRRTELEWQLFRDYVNAADNPLIAAGGIAWTQIPAGTTLGVPYGMQGILLAFIGDHASDPNDLVAVANLWAYRSRGFGQMVGTYTLTVGNLAISQEPWDLGETNATAKYIDSIVESDPQWLSTPKILARADHAAIMGITTYDFTTWAIEFSSVGVGLSVATLAAFIRET